METNSAMRSEAVLVETLAEFCRGDADDLREFRGWKTNYTTFSKDNPQGNYLPTSDVATINKILLHVDSKRPEIKNIIIDDAQYIMSFEAMDRAKERGFDKFTEIAQKFYSILKESISLREDLNIIVSCHAENIGTADDPKFKIKTVGR